MRLNGVDRYKLTHRYLNVQIFVKIRLYFDDLEASPHLKYKSLCTDVKSISVVRNIQTLCLLQCIVFKINKIEYARIVTCCPHFKAFYCRVSLPQLSKSINLHYKW